VEAHCLELWPVDAGVPVDGMLRHVGALVRSPQQLRVQLAAANMPEYVPVAAAASVSYRISVQLIARSAHIPAEEDGVDVTTIEEPPVLPLLVE
jgi:hypothetical protein